MCKLKIPDKMKSYVKIGKAFSLLFLIYHRNRTLSHSKNLAFFGLSDDKECKFFLTELDIRMEELNEIVYFLAKGNFVRLVQILDTFFVFLTEKSCRFVQESNISEKPRSLRVWEMVNNEKNETN